MRKFNESVTVIAACVTFMDFFYISYDTVKGPLSPIIVPVLLLLLVLSAFFSSKKDIRIAIHKIIMGYCLYSCGLVGVMAPLFTLVNWLFSSNVKFENGLVLFGGAVLIQLAAGIAFALVGLISFKRWQQLNART